MDKDNLKILNDLNKAIKMGEDSYAVVIEKSDDEKFKKVLKKQSKAYEKFLENVHKEYKSIKEEPKDTPIAQKIMGWTGIQMNTLMDSSNSHISEMLIQGAIMGYIECQKLLNSNPKIDEKIKEKVVSFSDLQCTVIKELTPYLRK